MRDLRPRLLVAAGLLAATLATLTPLFRPGLWVSDEELHWPMRLAEFAEALRQGQWWPRWFPDFQLGHGYPFPHFYAPGALWLGLPLLLATGSPVLAVKLAYGAAAFLAPWGMYRFVRLHRAPRGAAFAAALIYLFAPYHTLNIFVRGNLAETLAMGLFPWMLWAVWRAVHRSDLSSVALAAVLTCAYQLSHNLSALFGTGILVLLLIARGCFHRWAPRVWLRLALALTLGTLLGTVYWLPALWDSRSVRVAEVAQTIVAADHGIHWWQLFDPRWGWGYSVPGPADELSLQLGAVQWLALAAGAATLALARRRDGPLALWVIAGAALTLLTTAWLSGLWALPVLRMIQFPWRLLAYAVAACAVAGGLTLRQWSDRAPRAWIALAALTVVTQVWHCRAEFYREAPAILFEPATMRAHYGGTTTDGEYLRRDGSPGSADLYLGTPVTRIAQATSLAALLALAGMLLLDARRRPRLHG